MKKEVADRHDREQRKAQRGRPEWRTGTVIDHYTPVYESLLGLGIKPGEAAGMDLSVVAVLLGKPADGPSDPAPAAEAQGPVLPDGSPVPATSAHGIRPPKFWRGDDAAFATTVQGARELGMAPVLEVDASGDEAAPPEGRVRE